MTRSRTRNIVLVSLTVALTTAGAWLKVPVGPVPISLQTFFVILSGAVLGPVLGATAMVVYLIIGLIGMPVFTAGGGPGYLVSPTFGFLFSFPLSALTVGFLHGTGNNSFSTHHRYRSIAAFTAGTAVIYLIGVPWLWINLKIVQGKELGIGALLMLGVVPFLPGDFLKIVLASLLTTPIKRVLELKRG